MPVFEFQGPDGSVFEIESPDKNSAMTTFQKGIAKMYPENSVGTAQQQQLQKPQMTGQPSQARQGNILPVSRDEQGNVKFPDWDAGLSGSIKRSVQLPRQVMSGEVDMNTEEGLARALEMGTLVTGSNPAIRAGDRVIAGEGLAMQPAKPRTPTHQEILAAGSKGYNDINKMQVDYDPQKLADHLAKTKQRMDNDEGIDPINAPKAFNRVQGFENVPAKGPDDIRVVVPASKILNTHKKLKRIKPNAEGGEDANAAGILRRELDEFLQSPDNAVSNADSASKLAQALKDANANWRTGKKSETLNTLDGDAELSAAAAASGANMGNRQRQLLDALRKSDRKGYKRLDKDEVDSIEAIIKGNRAENTTRFLGNLGGGGGGLGMSVTSLGVAGLTGAATGGVGFGSLLAGASIPVASKSAKAISNALTKRSVKALDESIRAKSPLAKKMKENPPNVPEGPTRRAALIRELIRQQLQLEQGQNPMPILRRQQGA